jgi:hypothetical protein
MPHENQSSNSEPLSPKEEKEKQMNELLTLRFELVKAFNVLLKRWIKLNVTPGMDPESLYNQFVMESKGIFSNGNAIFNSIEMATKTSSPNVEDTNSEEEEQMDELTSLKLKVEKSFDTFLRHWIKLNVTPGMDPESLYKQFAMENIGIFPEDFAIYYSIELATKTSSSNVEDTTFEE